MTPVSTLEGHDAAWRAWRQAMAGHRMHHAWLLAGRKGLGKAAFAQAAARELVAEAGMPQPAGTHPDILHITHLPANEEEAGKRDEGKPYQVKRSIAVDQIRGVQHRLTTRPTLGARRVVIIDPADDLERNAANALLKSLEEPPTGTFFLLIAHRPGGLLPTIRSRCRLLRFPDLAADAVDAVLRAHAPQASPDARAAAVAAASGSPGAALDFLDHDLGPIHAAMARLAEEGDPRFLLRGVLADAMGARPARERQLAAIELARAVLAARLRNVAHADLPALITAHEAICQLAATAPTANFDASLLVMEIGRLLASAAPPSERSHG